MSRVLEKAGAMLYKVVVQTVLMCGSKSWFITDLMMKMLEGLHHLVTRRIVGNIDWNIGEEGWEWSLVDEALDEAGMWPMQDYVWTTHAIIEDYIAT